MTASRSAMASWRSLWPWWGTALVAVALHWLTHIEVDWTAWRPATCMPDDCFCEALRSGWIRQPANTWSNLAFVLVGLLAARGPVQPVVGGAVAMRDDPVVRGLYGFTALVIGLGSWWYHASMTFAGQWIDVLGMYLLPTFLVCYNLLRAGRLPRLAFLPAWLLVNGLLGVGLVVLPLWRRPVFGALLGLALLSEVVARRALRRRLAARYMLGALAALALAFGIWWLDLKHILCAPHSLFQGHALWHILCAMAAWWIWGYYASEAPETGRDDDGTDASSAL